jgi:hypothetical protein
MQRQTILTSAEWGGFQAGLWGRLTLLIVAATVFIFVLPVGVDYPIFADAARSWLAGRSRLFDTEALGFFYAPWSMIIFAPLSFLPDSVGSALINAASFAAMLLAVRLLIGQVPWYAVVIPIANIWTANLIGSAQWDALITAAVAVAFYAVNQRRPWLLGAAVVFVGIKPTNAWLPMLLVAALMLQTRWAWRSWLEAATIPALALLTSFLISGWDWPLRYLDFVAAHPPNAGYNASFFKLRGAGPLPIGMALAAAFCAALALFITIKRRGIDGLAVAIGLATNLMISPYVTIYHYVAMIPAAAWLGKRDVLYLVGLYAASVAWVIVRPSGPWLLPIYPLVVSASLVISCLKIDMPESLPA